MRIDPDNWLAGVLGKDAYRISVAHHPSEGDPEQGDSPFGDDGPKPGFYYAKVPTTNVAAVRALSAAGLYVVDVSTTFDRAPEALPEPALLVRGVRTEDAEAVLDIAGSCFVYSRFHLDPQVPNEIAHRIKREWIDSYLHGRRGDRLLVVEVDGQPAGFLAVLIAKIAGEPCQVIDLIGVGQRFQGRGAGKALVQQFVREGAGKCELLRVGTQVANVPSSRLYEQCGFRLAESAYVLHGHF